MQIILVRHAEAETPAPGASDAERPLTDTGMDAMRRNAAGLRRLLQAPPDCVASSPYLRAIQSAKIVVKAFKKADRPRFQTLDALSSGAAAAEVAKWLRDQPSDSTLVLVGHEPDMSLLLAYLTTKSNNPIAKFSKSAACLIECDTAPGRDKGRLIWFAAPRVLHKLGKKR